MTRRPTAVVVGAYEHPGRHLPGYTVPQLHHEVAAGALADAGLDWSDVDGYLCDSSVPGLGPMSMVEYLGLHCSYLDSTDVGGSTYVADLGHAAAAIASGACRVALVTMGGLPRSAPSRNQAGAAMTGAPEDAFERVGTHGAAVDYALAARRHMHEFGTTAEQLAWVKVAASRHAAHNPHAMLPTPVTVEDVLASPMVSDPLHRLDCCVVTDGGGALVVVHPDVARELGRAGASLRGHGEASRDADGGRVDLTASAAAWSGAQAFAAAGVTPADIRYASIYDSFTITVLLTLEDLGFCARGEGGHFVTDAGLSSPGGRLPVNTDGGGLCSNHPANRGGMTKVVEAVRQLRGEAAPALQVPDLELALVSGTGGRLSSRHVSATAVLEAWR